MTIWQMGLLVAAGLAGGLANAMAGGASIFTFPAFLAAGLSPVASNATNSFSLLPANSLAALADKGMIPERNLAFYLACLVDVLGGLLGAVLLLSLSPQIFEDLVPALLAFATLSFAFSAAIRRGISYMLGGSSPHALRLPLIFPAAIYNGFFGAGVGVIFIAVLAATGAEEFRRQNAFKNILSVLSNLGCVAVFWWEGMIVWQAGFVTMAGTAVGGYLGGKLVQVLPHLVVRRVIISVGTLMSLAFAYRFWL